MWSPNTWNLCACVFPHSNILKPKIQVSWFCCMFLFSHRKKHKEYTPKPNGWNPKHWWFGSMILLFPRARFQPLEAYPVPTPLFHRVRVEQTRTAVKVSDDVLEGTSFCERRSTSLERPMSARRCAQYISYINMHTPWKINMDHNHGGLEDHFPFQMSDLDVTC